MKKHRTARASRKQLAFELGGYSGRIASGSGAGVARLAEPELDKTPPNVICINGEIARQEQAERGMYYANIIALAKHLD